MSVLATIAGTLTPGTLYGVGVGPGDVRYLTLRAAAIIQSVEPLVYCANRGRQSSARRVVAPLVGAGRWELVLEYAVTDEFPVEHPNYQSQIMGFYRDCATQLAEGSASATRQLNCHRIGTVASEERLISWAARVAAAARVPVVRPRRSGAFEPPSVALTSCSATRVSAILSQLTWHNVRWTFPTPFQRSRRLPRARSGSSGPARAIRGS